MQRERDGGRVNLAFTNSKEALEAAREFKEIAGRLFPDATADLIWKCYAEHYKPIWEEQRLIKALAMELGVYDDDN